MRWMDGNAELVKLVGAGRGAVEFALILDPFGGWMW